VRFRLDVQGSRGGIGRLVVLLSGKSTTMSWMQLVDLRSIALLVPLGLGLLFAGLRLLLNRNLVMSRQAMQRPHPFDVMYN
jgi:hypothetical protein